MVVYLDLAFFLNSAADALALYVTARLAGLPVRRLRILAAAVLGAIRALIQKGERRER